MSQVELSKDGIKISYMRFLSDTSAGYILILFLVLTRGGEIAAKLPQSAVTEAAGVFVFLLLFVLATPLGLAINAVSWFALGGLQIRLQCLIYQWKPLFRFIRREYRLPHAEELLAIDRASTESWYDRSQLAKQTLYAFYPGVTSDLEHVRGIRTLFRNLSFLALTFGIAGVLQEGWPGWTFLARCAAIFVVFTCLSALTAFNYNCQVLDRVHLLCRASGERGPITPDQDLVHELARIRPLVLGSVQESG